MKEIGLLAAFTGGLLAFFSPCVLPLIPSYLSFIAGTSYDELINPTGSTRRKLLLNSLFFVLGFSTIFILLGATATAVGQFLLAYKVWIERIGGALIIIFGLHFTGIIRIGFLDYEKKVELEEKPVGYLGSFLAGAAFSAGWTPCIGPILASILILAGSTAEVGKGVLLLAAFSAGLALPFLFFSVLVQFIFKSIKQIRRYTKAIVFASGVFLILVGLTLMVGYFSRLTEWFYKVL